MEDCRLLFKISSWLFIFGIDEKKQNLIFQRNHPGNIFSNNIKLKVYSISRKYLLHICVCECIGNDGNPKMFFGYIKNSKAYSIQTDRAFLNDQLSKFFRKFKTKFPAPI